MTKETIVIYTQYYPPVANACTSRVNNFVLALKDTYKIKIVTWMPNYPTWIKEKWYKWKLFKKEIGKHWEEICHTYELAWKNEWSLFRLLNYISFLISSFIYGLFMKKPKMIIVTSPPLFTAISVLGIHKIRRIPYILDIRDLWPESVVALWYMKKKSISYKVFSFLETSLYKNAYKVVWVTQGICDFIKNKNIAQDKIFLQYNISEKVRKTNAWVDPYIVIKWRENYEKICLFAGNMNEAYDFDATAKHIKTNAKNFFVFIWDGSKKQYLKDKISMQGNVLFLDRMPKEQLLKYLYYSDQILVPLCDDKFYEWTFPAKWIEWIVNRKEIIFFGPKNGEFKIFLDEMNLNSDYVNTEIFEFSWFQKNITNLISNEG